MSRRIALRADDNECCNAAMTVVLRSVLRLIGMM